MSSLIRNIARKAARNSSNYEPKPQKTVAHIDGGYSVLHPTRGWQRFSARRLRAIQRTAEMLSGQKGVRV